ncbi:MAG: ABC transporter substrate-binding protein [Deltaproteobacteria bacterium]|nr:ABC transporter substrate-binding protein [Deltaproteobacteria bacterium]
MSLTKLSCMYGHLEGIDGKFARDITGYLSIDAGIYAKHGLEVSWNHVQGTEERYRRLANGEAQLSFVVGRASLQHFLDTKTTRVIGCAMNTCPYLLVADGAIKEIKDLKGQTVVCREGPARGVPLGWQFQQLGGLALGHDFQLKLVPSDQEAFHTLLDKKAAAAIVPRPYGFVAEDKGFHRMVEWNDLVDDPLPITIETTQKLFGEREKDFRAFLAAHSEGIVHAKANREKAVQLLIDKFGHYRSLAERTFDDYLCYMDESLTVDVKQLSKLLAQVALQSVQNAREVAAEWLMAGALLS